MDLDILKWFDETFEFSAGGNVSKSLTGQSATFSEGTITAAWSGSATLGAQRATFTEGSLAPNISYPLAGLSAVSTEGALTYSVSYALVGRSITSTEGTIPYGIAYGISGESATFTEGTITATLGGDVTITLSGQAATFSEGSLAAEADYSLAGQSLLSTEGTITGEIDYALTGLTGTFSEGVITPQVGGDITLTLSGLQAVFAEGQIAISGQDIIQPSEVPAGRKRFRDIYRVTIDEQVFEFRSLAAAIQFLNQAKEAAALLAARKVAEASEKAEIPKFELPKIKISSRDLRPYVSATKAEISRTYRQAAIDAEIAILLEVQAKSEYNEEVIWFLMQ